MADTIIHVGDVGTVFTLTITETNGTTAVDISTATVKTFYFMKPDGTKVNKTASFTTNGTDGKLTYTTAAADISMAGTWQVQAYVEIGTSKYYSSKTTFAVHSNIA